VKFCLVIQLRTGSRIVIAEQQRMADAHRGKRLIASCLAEMTPRSTLTLGRVDGTQTTFTHDDLLGAAVRVAPEQERA
jgi:hypothetical protein